MHLHICDICGGKLEEGIAAVLTLAPQLPPGEPPPQSAYAMMQLLSQQPVRTLEFCKDCLRQFLAIKATRPPAPPAGTRASPWGSIVLDRMFTDPSP